MGVIFKIAIRNMKRRKTRYILTTITLVIGVALFGGILIARDSFKVMFVKDIDNRMGTADILIRESELHDGWFRPSALEDIEDIPHIDYISYRIAGFDVYTSWTPNGNQIENSTRTSIYGIDIDSDDEEELGSKPYIIDSDVDGDTIEELLDEGLRDYGKNTIVITESLQIKLGTDFEAGDKIWVLPIDYHLKIGMDQDIISSNTGLWPKYTVAAIIRDLGEARDFDPETPSTYDTPSSGPCLFASIETTHDLVDGIVSHTGQYNLAAVGVDDVNNNEEVIDDIEDELGDDWSVADLKTDSVEDINDSVDMMMTILLMFAVIALILSIILILNIFNIIKEEQEYETGMLQAVGASRSETFKMFLTQGVVMGVIGAIIGTICSYFMSYLIFYITVESLKNLPGEFGEMFAQTEFEIILYPHTIAITLGVGIFSCILAAIYPSWKASRKPLIECLNPLAHKAEREKKHHKRKIAFVILASLLIALGTYLLFGLVDIGPSRGGPSGGLTEATISIMAPTFILLGIIGLMAIFVGPITKGFIKIFGPYLKQTKLLTRKNVLRHRKRTVLTFSMIALTVSYLVGISVLMGSFREGVHTTVNNVMGCDIRIFTANTPRSFKGDLKDIDGVDDVMGATHQNVQLFHEGRNKWIGHGLLEKDWDKSVTVHVLEPDTVKERMTETVIFEPSDMTLEEMMDDVSDENAMIITEDEAKYFDLDVDDEILAMFSLGISYPSIDDMLADNRENAAEDVIIANMKVVAIVEKFQGFATGDIIGQEEGAYNIYITWETYEKLARYNLPGGDTDIIFRQKTQSGFYELDAVQPNFFNFSDVYQILENTNEIDYYTTRMDYISPTYSTNSNFSILGFPDELNKISMNSSVVGIRTNSNGNLKDDSNFGQHQLISKSDAYVGSTMEEILNNTDNVVVVDETFVNNMRLYDPSFDIDSNITIFPQQFDPGLNTIYIGVGVIPEFPFFTDIPFNVALKNGTLEAGSNSSLVRSELVIPDTLDVKSNKNSLELNITVNLMNYFMSNPYFINPYNITIESTVDSTIEQLDLEVFNYFTNDFDKLGDFNSQAEEWHTFTFNQHYPPLSYLDITTGQMKLRIIGKNSTFDNEYTLAIDVLRLFVNTSTYTIDPETWPQYTVIGIIKDPVLYRTERLNWMAGYEAYVDVAETENAVYLNYEKAREKVYVHNKGSTNNGSNDKITHVLVHCKDVDDISKTVSSLRNVLGSNWTVVDLKTQILEFRTNVYDWYIWIEEGKDDEEVLEEVIEYMEDHGYIVMFAFTNSYITQIFESMVDLITLIMNGILVFAIIIAMIGLALHCLLTTMSRRREIGMLRSIGLNKKGVVRTISGETLVVALLGTLIGIFAGLLTGVLMVSSIPDTGFLTVTLTIPWLIIGLLILTTIVTAVVSSRYPSRWAANINIIDAVRTR